MLGFWPPGPKHAFFKKIFYSFCPNTYPRGGRPPDQDIIFENRFMENQGRNSISRFFDSIFDLGSPRKFIPGESVIAFEVQLRFFENKIENGSKSKTMRQKSKFRNLGLKALPPIHCIGRGFPPDGLLAPWLPELVFKFWAVTGESMGTMALPLGACQGVSLWSLKLSGYCATA